VWDIGGSGNDGGDAAFFAIECVGLLLWLFCFVMLARPPERVWVVALVLATGLCVAVPVGWNLLFPASNGLEGAGRMLLGAPWSIGNGALGCVWAIVFARRTRRRVVTMWPFAANLVAGVLLWFR
jgi:hypothetical protein